MVKNNNSITANIGIGVFPLHAVTVEFAGEFSASCVDENPANLSLTTRVCFK